MTAASHIPVPVLAKSKGPVASLFTFGGKEEGCSSQTTIMYSYMLRKYLNRQLKDFSILRKSKKSKSEKESQEEPDKVSHCHDRCVSHQVVLVPGQEIIISFFDSFCLLVSYLL